MRRLAVASAASVVLVGCGAFASVSFADSSQAIAARVTEAQRIYHRAPTVSCLKEKRVVVTTVVPADRRLRALRDLAQKTSWQAKLGSRVVGVSINRTAADAELLLELLRVPNDAYRHERSANAVLLYRPSAAPLARTIRACLA